MEVYNHYVVIVLFYIYIVTCFPIFGNYLFKVFIQVFKVIPRSQHLTHIKVRTFHCSRSHSYDWYLTVPADFVDLLFDLCVLLHHLVSTPLEKHLMPECSKLNLFILNSRFI